MDTFSVCLTAVCTVSAVVIGADMVGALDDAWVEAEQARRFEQTVCDTYGPQGIRVCRDLPMWGAR